MAYSRALSQNQLHNKRKEYESIKLDENISFLENSDPRESINALSEISGERYRKLSPTTIEQLNALIRALKEIRTFNFSHLADDRRFYALKDRNKLNEAISQLNNLLSGNDQTQVTDVALEPYVVEIKESLACRLTHHYRNERISGGVISAGIFIAGMGIIVGACVFAPLFAVGGFVFYALGLFVILYSFYKFCSLEKRAKSHRDSLTPDPFKMPDNHESEHVHPLGVVTKCAISLCEYFVNLKKIRFVESENTPTNPNDDDFSKALSVIKLNRKAKLDLLQLDLDRINGFIGGSNKDGDHSAEYAFLEQMKTTIEARISVMSDDAYLAKKLVSHTKNADQKGGQSPSPGRSVLVKNKTRIYGLYKQFFDHGVDNSKRAVGYLRSLDKQNSPRSQLVIGGLDGSNRPDSSGLLFFTHSRKLNHDLLSSDAFEKFCKKDGYQCPYSGGVLWGKSTPNTQEPKRAEVRRNENDYGYGYD